MATKKRKNAYGEDILYCPECGSDRVIVRAVTSYMVNTGEHYCHSVKTHDSDASAGCLECNWEAQRQDLSAAPVDSVEEEA